MTGGDYAAQASLHRAALLLGLTRGEEVIAWADAVLADDEAAPAAFVEIAATPPEELTAHWSASCTGISRPDAEASATP